MKAIGIDVGGTFTDFVYFDHDADRVEVMKISSGEDIAATIAGGIRDLCAASGVSPAEIDLVMHGTTVATNAILEYEGAKTGMITTEGFRDIIHIGRHQRPHNYSIQQDIPWQARPLVEREFRRTVPERLLPPTGEVLTPLDEDAVRVAAEYLRDEGVEAVAVCFLFSDLDDVHERRAAEIVAEVLPGAFVCTSSDVVPQFREFERFTTTAINAFVGPPMKAYIERLAERIEEAGVTAPLHIMQSNGGTATPDVAATYPVRAILSGPVGGVMGGVWAAGSAGEDGDRRLLTTLDVGGTSADIGIVTEAGLVEARARDTWIAGYPVMVPIIDIETIGAGGGSIAYLDQAGALHVGPRSAGAHPGPAAYGRGGTEPTVTDANVVLGRLPGSLAGGLELDHEAAAAAVGSLAEAMGRSSVDAAAAIVRIVNENMAAAMRTKTIERGLDPRQFLLAAFGGGGPVQAAELARILEIPQVLIPPNPGVTSAAGLLTSDLRYDVGQSYPRALSELDPAEAERIFAAQEESLRARLRADGRPADTIRLERAADLRYRGQSYELKLQVPAGEFGASTQADLRQSFHELHEEEFGHSFLGLDVQLVTLRVTAIGSLPHIRPSRAEGDPGGEAVAREVEVYFERDGEVAAMKTPVLERDRIPVEEEFSGPAVVVQLDSTTVIPPGVTFRRQESGNLLLAIDPT
ncbi:MAG TPA: hydantoinase/oxoprolinase family protein [Solirubrobacterales bacterium]|nr:hydantoinase/oxoprolinase family protein [Solirubrobacterales bacterium]